MVNAFHNHPPSNRLQSTDGSASVTTSIKTQIFKLNPVLPPTKDKVFNLKPCSLPDKSNINLTQQVALVSSTNKNVPVTYTLAKDASTFLVDDAIISIGQTVSLNNSSERISKTATGELNDSEVARNKIGASALSTRDESSDSSLGEKERRIDRPPKSEISYKNKVVSVVKHVNLPHFDLSTLIGWHPEGNR